MPGFSDENNFLSQQDLGKQQYTSNVSRIRTTSTSESSRKEGQKVTLLEKIGTLNLSVIFIGSLLIIGISIFLWFLWTGNDSQPLWRWLILNGYLQRAATLSSVALRTIIAIQTSLCTSMIVASIMELSNGFSLMHSASLSIQRFSPSLPIFLLKSGVFKWRIWYLLVVTVVISTTSMASHFISTSLIADLSIAPIFGEAIIGEMTYSLNSSKLNLLGQYETDFTTSMPSIFPAFGEYSEPANKSKAVDDTGPLVRAFLPITSATTRQRLSNYTGFGTLLNSRVLCLKPLVRNLTLVNSGGLGQAGSPYLTGSVSIGASLPQGITFLDPPAVNNGLNIPNPLNWLSFTCWLSKASSRTADWSISMCVAGNFFADPVIPGGGDEGRTRMPIVGTRATSMLYESLLDDPLSYVLVNYSGQLPAGNGLRMSTAWKDIASDESSWGVFQNLNKTSLPNIDFVSLTYCFTNFAAIDTNISVSSPTNRTEPVLRSGNTSTNLVLNTSEVLLQLGSDGSNSSLAERGVLDLEFSDKWKTTMVNVSADELTWMRALDGTYGFGMKLDANSLYPNSQTWALCTNCGVSVANINTNTTGVSAALSSIFQSSLKTTGSAATALSAMFTVVNTMQYYERLQQFDEIGPTSTILIEQQLQPVHRSGVLIVTIGLAIHILVVVIITAVYLASTGLSFIGEAWHTLAQLQSQDVISILNETSLMRDDEVEHMMKKQETRWDEMVLVGEEGKEGRSEAHLIRRKGVGNFF